jgi:hypothetical protein
MASEIKAQGLVHSLELGKGRWWITFGLLIVFIAYQVMVHLFFNPTASKSGNKSMFLGLEHAKGMEQAVIARELSRGHGFSTKVIKPAAVRILEDKFGTGTFASLTNPAGPTQGNLPDFFHAPLNPLVNAAAIKALTTYSEQLKDRLNEDQQQKFWEFQKAETVHPADRVIAATAVFFYLLAVGINYFTLKRLFDRRLAFMTTLLLLFCNRFWEFSSTGLPQLLLLFLFSAATWFFVRALFARQAGRMVWHWMIGAGICFGLMLLAHPLTAWLLIGAILYAAFAFRPYGREAGILAVVAILCFTPWLVRNQRVCGNALGLSWQTRTFQLRGTESQIMRTLSKPDESIEPTNYFSKLQGQTLNQLEHLYGHFGKIITVPFFFIALLHFFRKPETRSLRWSMLWMWLFGVFGMSFFGFSDYDLNAEFHANDLHLLFIPMMAGYGLAFLLVMWGRIETQGRELARIPIINAAFHVIIVFLSSLPLFSTYLNPPQMPVPFPPYFPSVIQSVGNYYNENDVICSDMPWAVAWYTDKKSLWLPLTISDFNTLNDFHLNGKITALLFTPITGYKGLLSEVAVGEFREWYYFITRDPRLPKNTTFPLAVPKNIFIGKGNNYYLYSDRDRWTERQ